ncbi:amino acid adenylation domain-containing protein [Dokdonia sp.]|uniref:amino acid adenylation domain-containing protein n=1 Tax=Dokdonia sp. TaxID=2024995 RepID=UPI0032668A12
MISKHKNLIEVLQSSMTLKGKGLTFIESVSKEDYMSYTELYDTAHQVLFVLQERGIKPKSELVFQIEDNKTFVIVFWACILGGIIPVPLTVGIKEDHKMKLFNVWSVLKKPYLVTTESLFEECGVFAKGNDLSNEYTNIGRKVLYISNLFELSKKGDIFKPKPNDIAFIQFSSGSTGNPKGVILTHKNLITNINAISCAADYTSSDSMLSWMPLTHDMGLIGFHLNPVYRGMSHFLIPTNLFVRRPTLWFDKTSKHKISILSSPNFGYKYIMENSKNQDKSSWDLSSVRLLYNGAEPISEKLCYEFIDWARPYKLNKKAMCPVYGLAEASLAVTISGLKDEIRTMRVKRNSLNIGNRIVESHVDDDSTSFVNVGKVIKDCSVAIANEDFKKIGEDVVGNIIIKGDNVTEGYYNDKSRTDKVLRNKWLKTGDLGFIKNECLYVTGRAKDIIFVNGQNYYPNDIEGLAHVVEGIDLNKIAVVGFFNQNRQKEEVIAFVSHRGDLAKFLPILQKLQSTINAKIEIQFDSVIPVKRLPRTTSGKLQRFKLLEQYQSGYYNVVQASLEECIKESDEVSHILVAPDNKTEEKLLLIWKSVLKLKKIGVTDNFFALGGNSLKAAQIAIKVENEFGLDLPVSLLNKFNTIKELSQEFTHLSSNKLSIIPLSEKREYFPISPVQKRIFFAWELDKTSTAYNNPQVFRINGTVDIKILQSAICQIIEEHSILRAAFMTLINPQFFIRERIDVPITQISAKSNNVDQVLEKLVKPFDITSDSLVRISLVSVDDDSFFLFLDFHHIIMDGMSVVNFIGELFKKYKGTKESEKRLNYEDYVMWQTKKIRVNNLDRDRRFWIDLYKGEIPVLNLPTTYQRPPIFETTGKRVQFTIDSKTSELLRGLAAANSCSLHAVMFSIYTWFLSKISGQSELIVGIPISGRDNSHLSNMLGMFVNNLPVQVNVQKRSSFVDNLQDNLAMLYNCFEHQEFPYSYMVDELVSVRDVSRNPLFDTMFMFPSIDFENETNEFEIERHFFNQGYSKFDLSMEVYDDKEIKYVIEYAISLFDSSTILGFSSYFEILIEQIVANPKVVFSEISLLRKEDLRKQIEVFNATEKSVVADETIISLFEKQVRNKPNNIAIEFDEISITYGQLDKMAENFKSKLLDRGVSNQDVVAVCLKRSPELIIALLGILKMNGVYLPIDTETPNERIQFLLENSGGKFLVSHPSYIKEELFDYEYILVNNDFAITNASETFVNSTSTANDTAYLIYTSGTSGNPKGVMISHASISNYVKWAMKEYIAGEKSCFPLFTSIDFDLTLTSIFLPLASGNSIVIHDNDETQIPLQNVIRDQKVNIVKLTPSHLKILINNKINIPDNIKKIIVGGEKLTFEICNDLSNLYDHEITLYNEYGPTEATIGCMIYKYDSEELHLSVPIGIPIDNSIIYILDEFLNPVPENIVGEIYISGKCLAKGYINNSLLTKEKFIQNPFAKDKTMYRSGDLAKRLSTGEIIYIGRLDKQVKINGHRIETDEIRHVLLSYIGITDAVVISTSSENDSDFLCVFYSINTLIIKHIELVKLKAYLHSKLPSYMIPSRFIEIDKMPLTKNGKLDTRKLMTYIPDKSKSILPRSNDLDQMVLDIYKNVLQDSNINIQSDFYQQGGDSIKAIQIASKLRQLGINLKPKSVLIYNTVEQLVFYISNDMPLENIEGIHFDQGIIDGDKTLLPIDIWFLNNKFENPHYYNQSVLLKLNKKVKISILNRCFEKLITHHDGLRLNFDIKKQKSFFNKTHLNQKFTIKNCIINSEHELTRVMENLKKEFQLNQTLLIKAALVEIKSSNEILLFITAHHLVVDGISWRIILEDLQTIYDSFEKNKPLELPKKTASVGQFANALKEFVKKINISSEEQYWSNISKQNLELPLISESLYDKVENLMEQKLEIGKEETRWLLTESAVWNLEPQILLMTALARALGQICGGDRIKMDIENHGRHLEDIDVSRTVGWFTVIHPIVFSVKGEIKDQLKSVKEEMGKIPNYGIGYMMTDKGKLTKNVQQGSFAEVRFNYLGQFGKELHNNLFKISDRDIGNESDKLNSLSARLEINALVYLDSLRISFNYSSKSLNTETIIKLKELFAENLNQLMNALKNSNELILTPSDFDSINISQSELDSLF